MDRGSLVWESPSVKDAPKLLLWFIGGAFLALAAAGALFTPGLRSPHIDQTEQGRRVTFGLIGISAVFGIFLILRAFFPTKVLGVYFFTHGVEYGPTSKRRYIPYPELERFSLEPLSQSRHDFNDTIAAAHLVLAVLATNPSGIAYGLTSLLAEKVDSFVVIKPCGEKEFRIAVFKDVREMLIDLVTSHLRV